MNTLEEEEVPCVSTTKEVPLPKGLFVIQDFISKEEEAEIMKEIDSKEWTQSIGRRVQHYGYEFNYKTKNVDPSQTPSPLPEYCTYIIQRMKEK